MTGADEDLARLARCCDTVYAVLGAAAPTFTRDAAVVVGYESARLLGELALALVDAVGAERRPIAAVASTLRAAIDGDPTGDLALYALALVVGPRLSVAARDARERADAAAAPLLAAVAAALVEVMWAAGRAVDPARGEDLAWQSLARALDEALNDGPDAETFQDVS